MNEETPVQWCERMIHDAKDGETAYHYHQLKEQWESKTNE